MSSSFGFRDRFCFPFEEDKRNVTKNMITGVITQIKGTTQILANTIRFHPPLTNYNVR